MGRTSNLITFGNLGNDPAVYQAVVPWDIKCTACFVLILGECLQIVYLFPEFYDMDETVGVKSAAPRRILCPKAKMQQICILCVSPASWRFNLRVFQSLEILIIRAGFEILA